jgi:NADH-quinone oxidoreductase subunit E
VARLTPDNEQRALDLISLYPHPRSALIPMLHVLQEQDGYLTEDGMEHLGELLDLSAAEVQGTASFYDMFHLEPVGKYVVAVCTNIACMLQGAYALLDHIEDRLGVAPGGTTVDELFTVEDAECLALCGNAPCVTVNWRFFGDVTPESFDTLVDDLAAGRLDDEVPPHGTLSRVPRTSGLTAAGRSINGAGGPPSGWSGAAPDVAPPTTSDSPTAGVRLDTPRTTTAVASLDGGRTRQPLGPQTPMARPADATPAGSQPAAGKAAAGKPAAGKKEQP